MKQNNKHPPFDNQTLTQEDERSYASHVAFLGQPHRILLKELKPGDVIQFTYDGEERTVFVLNPDWQLKLHGLSMAKIDRTTLLNEIFDKAADYRTPIDMYERVIKRKEIMKTDSYRTYNIRKIGNLTKVSYNIENKGNK